MDLDVSAGSYRTLSVSATAGMALGKDVVAGISASDTTSDGYNKTPPPIATPIWPPHPATTPTFPPPSAPPFGRQQPVGFGLWHRLSMQDLVWQGTENRWESWRIGFGGDKGWARASWR
jgi:hypothetical protein